MLKIHHQASFTQILLKTLPPSSSFHVGILLLHWEFVCTSEARLVNYSLVWEIVIIDFDRFRSKSLRLIQTLMMLPGGGGGGGGGYSHKFRMGVWRERS